MLFQYSMSSLGLHNISNIQNFSLILNDNEMQHVAMQHMEPVFFLSILWCSQGGNHPLVNLANLGY
jgi:hypothetical protein